VLRSGCQWKGLKKEWYGASSSLHKRFQEWNETGLWKRIYRLIVKYYQKKRRIQWKWQAVESKMVATLLGGDLTGSNPTDRAKSGSKRHIWVDQRGAPLSIRVTAANAHDVCVTEIMNLLNRPNCAQTQKRSTEFNTCLQTKPTTRKRCEPNYANEISRHTSANVSTNPIRSRRHL